MLKRCIEEDAAYTYKEVVDVESDTDLKNLDCAAGGFHDAYVEKAEKNGDSVYVLFGGVWGCEVEMFFDGDADFCIDARSGEHDDPYWFDSTLFRDGEYIYLADAEKLKPGDITNNYCWFRGKHLKYRIIPGEKIFTYSAEALFFKCLCSFCVKMFHGGFEKHVRKSLWKKYVFALFLTWQTVKNTGKYLQKSEDSVSQMSPDG